MTNIITANLSRTRFFRCAPVYQYNYGMRLVIAGIDLPTAYQVDFSNDMTGTSVTQIGDASGVTIPAQFFIPGQAIYCWLRVHPTQDSGVTTATIVIPISPRATITDEEPTPEEQSAIDEAIAALNDAVDRADEAVEHYPTITGGIWYVWDVDAGEYTSTGVPAQGPQGDPGQHGDDGYSPTATVTKAGNTATITITDKSGTTTATVSDGTNGSPGAPGADGFSPTASVSKSGDTATITITDKNGTTTAQISDGTNGQDGAPGVGVPAGGTTGQVLAKSSGADYSTEWVTPYTGTVTETVSGATPTITAQDNHRYICGEVSTLDITLPSSGILDVVFTSGSTATVLTVTPPTGVTVKWANGFDPSSLDANTTYEINIMDGLGVAATWT